MKQTVWVFTIATALAGSFGATPAMAAPLGVRAVVKTYAIGLNSPRGMAFGPDGALYVAEAGDYSETTSTAGECQQVQPPVGPRTGGYGGRVSRIDSNGNVTTVADELPSATTGHQALGPMAVAFAGHRMYVLDVAGCSHGLDGDPSGVIEILPGDSWSLTADLSAYLQTHPDAKPTTAPDYEPDGTWYGMVFRAGKLYAVEPNHGQLVSIDREGTVSFVADLFTRIGDFTPASMVYKDGWFYIGFEGQIPGFVAGIYRVSVNGQHIEAVNTTLSSVLGVAFGADGALYAIESTNGTAPPFFIPNQGKLVRVENDGSVTTLVTQLNFPTALIAGPDGALYVSNCGYGCNDGDGQVLRIKPR